MKDYCETGKVKYARKGDALRALKKTRGRGRRKGSKRERIPGIKETRVYSCPVCGGFHLASAARKKRRNKYDR